MHVPDGFVSNGVNAATFIISGAVCAVAARRAGKTMGEKQVPLMGITAAFIFAAQMLNFPVIAGTSGHFLGALMAALLLGPFNGCLVMAVVLAIQCLFFADGGITAIGTNLFNMGIAGGLGGWSAFIIIKAAGPKTRGWYLIAAAAASWFSIVLSATCCAVELALSGTADISVALPAMAGVHAVIGIGEAVITAAVMSAVMAARPDLINGGAPAPALAKLP